MNDECDIIPLLYVIGIIIWIIIIFGLGIDKYINSSYLFLIIILLPIIVFIINIVLYKYRKVNGIKNPELSLLKESNNFLVIGMFIFFGFILYREINTAQNYKIVIQYLMIAFALALISMYVFWTSGKQTQIKDHLKTIPYTYSITFLLLAIFYYLIIIQNRDQIIN